jgi:hypothetical protein
MSRRSRRIASEGALASVAGGAVTSDRLADAARREGHDQAPLVRSLLAQTIPAESDLARVYAASGGIPRIDTSLLRVSPKAARLLDVRLLRERECLPLAIFDECCILAVNERGARRAVEAVRTALRRDVLPVLADPSALRRALDRLGVSPPGVRLGVVRRKESATQTRFRSLVVGTEERHAVPIEERTR